MTFKQELKQYAIDYVDAMNPGQGKEIVESKLQKISELPDKARALRREIADFLYLGVVESSLMLGELLTISPISFNILYQNSSADGMVYSAAKMATALLAPQIATYVGLRAYSLFGSNEKVRRALEVDRGTTALIYRGPEKRKSPLDSAVLETGN